MQVLAEKQEQMGGEDSAALAASWTEYLCWGLTGVWGVGDASDSFLSIRSALRQTLRLLAERMLRRKNRQPGGEDVFSIYIFRLLIASAPSARFPAPNFQ